MAAPFEFLEKIKQLNKEKKYQEVTDLLPDDVLEEYKDADLYAEASEAYYRLGKIGLCKEAAEKSLTLNPKQAKGHNYKGNALVDAKEYDKAIEEYKMAIEADAEYPNPYNGMGNIYEQIFKQYDSAFEAYNMAVRLNPKFPYPYNGLGNVYYAQDLYDKAIEYYNKAIALDPGFVTPYYNLGLTYNMLNRYDEAIDAHTKATEIDKNLTVAFYQLAQLLYNKGNLQQALDNFNAFIALDKDDANNRINVAKSRVAEIEGLLKSTPPEEVIKLEEIANTVGAIKSLLLFTDGCITHYTSLTTAKILVLDKQKSTKTTYTQEDKTITKQDKTTTQPNRFRLSEGAYLNDPSEGQVLFDFLYDEIISNVQNRYRVPTLFAQKPFIGSFVAEQKHDDLTLWRMYGKEGKEEASGCAITLHKDEFIKQVTSGIHGGNTDKQLSAGNEFSFYRVAYLSFDNTGKNTVPKEEVSCVLPVKNGTDKDKNKEEEETLNGYVTTLKKNVTTYVTSANKRRDDAEDALKTAQDDETRKKAEEEKKKAMENLKNLTEKLNTIAYLFKGIAYQYEHEVRLIIDEVFVPNKIISTDGPRPRVFIELGPITSAIKKITLGPKVERPDEWASALHYTLNKDKIGTDNKAEILISHLPYK